jgi:hypothetical protein
LNETTSNKEAKAGLKALRQGLKILCLQETITKNVFDLMLYHTDTIGAYLSTVIVQDKEK